MSTLHIVNRPGVLPACLELLQPADVVLLCGDAVLAWPQTLAQAGATPVMVLADDMQARALVPDAAVQVIDYEGFVALCCTQQRVQAW